MKNALLVSFLLVFLFSCSQTSQQADEQTNKTEVNVTAIKTLELQVSGMTCEGCEKTIETALTNLNGVVSAEALHIEGITTVSFDTTLVNADLLSQTINNLGYKVN